MEAMHKERESNQWSAEELPPYNKMPRESASAKAEKKVKLTKEKEEESILLLKKKKKTNLFSCEEFLHDQPYWDKKQIQEKHSFLRP